ncbi:MAG: hypothetical protein KQI35_17955 [Bacteroidetes bacterium]|nr:hypothetical protein [Bacteroidota bacterium]
MKKILSLFILLALLSCNKNDSEDEPEVKPVNITYAFDDASALDAWNITTPNEAIVTIDPNDKVDGAGSLLVYSGCCVMELKTSVALKVNTNYGLTVNGKRTPYGQGDTVCAFPYALGLYVIQGEEELLSKPFGDSPNWKNESFYFNSLEGTEPVKIRIMVNTKEAWVDELKFEEI